MKTGIELIAEERKRQIEVEGFTAKHDYEEAREAAILEAIKLLKELGSSPACR